MTLEHALRLLCISGDASFSTRWEVLTRLHGQLFYGPHSPRPLAGWSVYIEENWLFLAAKASGPLTSHGAHVNQIAEDKALLQRVHG